MTRATVAVKPILVLPFAFFFLVSDAHAYLDPGTGSFVLQMLVAGLLGVLFYIKFAWHSVKSFFQRLFSRGSEPPVEGKDPSSEES